MKLRHALVVAAVGLGVVAAAGSAAAAGPATPVRPALASSAGFTAMTPVRVFDTDTGIGGGNGTAFNPNETRTFSVAAEVPTGATAVVLNLTAVNHQGNGSTYLTAWQAGQPRPDASTLNVDGWDNNGTEANLATVPVGADRTVAVYNHDGYVSVIADLAGYYLPGSGSGYTALTPATRVLDTRNGVGAPRGQLGANSTLRFDLSGFVPAGTTAVTLNLTATGGQYRMATYLTVWPDGRPQPDTSNINPTWLTTANLVTVDVGPDRMVDVYNHVGSIDVIADLAGYYVPGAGSGFTVVSPTRVLDTRNGTGGLAMPFGPGTIRPLDLSGSVPTGATSVLVNLTSTNSVDLSYITVWPDGYQQPVTSNLNTRWGDTIADLASVAVAANRTVDIYNNAGNTDLVGDLAGYFTAGS